MSTKFYIENTETGYANPKLSFDSREQAQTAIDHAFRGKSHQYRRVVEREPESLTPKKIVSARITAYPKALLDPLPEVWARLDGENDERKLFSFYPDEISFSSREFVGKTEAEAVHLKFERDLAYLRS